MQMNAHTNKYNQIIRANKKAIEKQKKYEGALILAPQIYAATDEVQACYKAGGSPEQRRLLRNHRDRLAFAYIHVYKYPRNILLWSYEYYMYESARYFGKGLV